MSSDDSDVYQDNHESKSKRKPNGRKRRKVNAGRAVSVRSIGPTLSLEPLLNQIDNNAETSFDAVMDQLLPEYLHTRAVLHENAVELDEKGRRLRPLTRSEVNSFIDGPKSVFPSLSETIALRKLKLRRERRQANVEKPNVPTFDGPVELLPPSLSLPPNPQVLDALYNIRTTPFENSFLARLHGSKSATIPGLIALDWETTTPWMKLMCDIRDHFYLAHPEREQAEETIAAIAYTSLQQYHLDQVHDLLERTFWTGINVSDSLDYSPERCTIVASYKSLVVGVAILSSPRETYITYLAVKAGWDNAQIARTMLYHLITLNPGKDITLHVSANNPAMLLYNKFGFKAEEFVAGFYEEYLDPQSRASKNAFRLRLRQQ